jgi:hypothetical protein
MQQLVQAYKDYMYTYVYGVYDNLMKYSNHTCSLLSGSWRTLHLSDRQ